MWRGVFSVRRVQEVYPHQWHRLAIPSPGQEWPDDWVPLGGCLECGATGLCPDCGGADIYPDADLYETDFSHAPINTDSDLSDDDAYYGDRCICEEDGLCPVCHGTRRQPAPDWYRIAKSSLSGTRASIEENRQSAAEEEYAWERRWERLLQTPWEHRFENGDYNEREWQDLSTRRIRADKPVAKIVLTRW